MEESDVFILSGAEDLVPAFKPGTTQIDEFDRDGYRVRRYRPRIEGLFAHIERWTNPDDARDAFWRSISPKIERSDPKGQDRGPCNV